MAEDMTTETWFSLVNRCMFDPVPDPEHLININTGTNPPMLQFGQAIYDMLKASGWELTRSYRNEPTFDQPGVRAGEEHSGVMQEAATEQPTNPAPPELVAGIFREISPALRNEKGMSGGVAIWRMNGADTPLWPGSVEEFLTKPENQEGTWLIDGGWGGPPGPVHVRWNGTYWENGGFGGHHFGPVPSLAEQYSRPKLEEEHFEEPREYEDRPTEQEAFALQDEANQQAAAVPVVEGGSPTIEFQTENKWITGVESFGS